MSDLMNLLFEYAQTHRVAGFLDSKAYEELARIQGKSLSELKEGLPMEKLFALEHYMDACDEQHLMDLEAMFLAGFSIARELL